MILQYTSSTGQTFDLKVGRFRTRTANFHEYEWTPQTIEQQYGSRVYRFDKESVNYTCTMSVFGTLDERRQWLNILHDAFEHDITNLTPGTITHGMFSIPCYINYSNVYYAEPFTYNDISIFCPRPFWTRETKFTLRHRTDDEYPYLDFPIGFPFDFKGTLPGYAEIKGESVLPYDWQLTIFGACTDPKIIIDDMIVGVYASIGANEEIVISSKDKTVIKNPSGANLFNSRFKGQMFEKLKAGTHAVFWSGNFDADIVLYAERSEPPWI